MRAYRPTVIVILAVLLALVGWRVARRPAIEPITVPSPGGFDAPLVLRGAQLAALGNCRTCHTATGGRSFAGGRAVTTRFGTVYSTNITPDPDTGIGRWSLPAFARAMHEGVDRRGRHLYPVFPYDHFTLLRDEDVAALYGYLMTREPVRSQIPANDLPFPLNMRPILAGWKLLFFRAGRYRADPRHDDIWNRGAYLAEGIAHCGGCHTPRNALGAEQSGRHWAGGDVEGWHAYAIDAGSQSPVPWDLPAMRFYLHHGWQALHGIARGPMSSVVENLAVVPEKDVAAIATYVMSVMGTAYAERLRRSRELLAQLPRGGPGQRPQSAGVQAGPELPADTSATLYAAACASCHESGRPLPFGGINLALSIGVSGEDPINLLHVVLDGLPPQGESPIPIMPGFAHSFSDSELLSLLSYLRARFAAKPMWQDARVRIEDQRRADDLATVPRANTGEAGGAPRLREEP